MRSETQRHVRAIEVYVPFWVKERGKVGFEKELRQCAGGHHVANHFFWGNPGRGIQKEVPPTRLC